MSKTNYRERRVVEYCFIANLWENYKIKCKKSKRRMSAQSIRVLIIKTNLYKAGLLFVTSACGGFLLVYFNHFSKEFPHISSNELVFEKGVNTLLNPWVCSTLIWPSCDSISIFFLGNWLSLSIWPLFKNCFYLSEKKIVSRKNSTLKQQQQKKNSTLQHEFLFLYFRKRVLLSHPGWSTVMWSWLIVASTSWAQVIFPL